jgi:hypothetical protein
LKNKANLPTGFNSQSGILTKVYMAATSVTPHAISYEMRLILFSINEWYMFVKSFLGFCEIKLGAEK